MSTETINKLIDILTESTECLPKIKAKKMFGCHALWVNDNVFALVWKHGRIGVKLPNEKSYGKLMAMTGAEPWKAGPMQMKHWVLVPEAFHKKPKDLIKWVAQAHTECSTLVKDEKKPSKTNKSKK